MNMTEPSGYTRLRDEEAAKDYPVNKFKPEWHFALAVNYL